ncbi:hypothetical protein [Kribbella deserti]|uniref:Uncharacterized protein n=1 Tax=Kribbella deserti TaxID=1926257 RepID=A0ABV6QW58_9ACTN
MAGATSVAEFDKAYILARGRVMAQGGATIADEQSALQDLAAGLTTDADRQWAASMIESLSVVAPASAAPAPSPLVLEASAVQRAALAADGTEAERIEALAEARHKIFELASKADAREASQIRGLARVLEHLEEGMRNSPWDEGPSASPSS